MQKTAEQEAQYWEERSTTKADRYAFTIRQILFFPVKRFFDILLSSFMLILLSPIFIIVSLLLKIERKGPIFFRQERVGKDGKAIEIIKFRTMSDKAPKDVATSAFTNSDEYITKLGKFLRKSSIDETPQFINVLKGDMSIVGPRPLVRSEKDIHTLRMKKNVYMLRPGITGLAQINGRDLVTPFEKVRYDEQYLHRFGFFMDFKILVRSAFMVLSRKGVVEGHEQCTKNISLEDDSSLNSDEGQPLQQDKVRSIG